MMSALGPEGVAGVTGLCDGTAPTEEEELCAHMNAEHSSVSGNTASGRQETKDRNEIGNIL